MKMYSLIRLTLETLLKVIFFLPISVTFCLFRNELFLAIQFCHQLVILYVCRTCVKRPISLKTFFLLIYFSTDFSDSYFSKQILRPPSTQWGTKTTAKFSSAARAMQMRPCWKIISEPSAPSSPSKSSTTETPIGNK